jgi:hypothetical protein
MPERIRSITEQGKQILLVDLSNCPPSEVADVARAVPNHVTTQPRASVLLLVDLTGASFDQEAIRVIKEAAVFDKPYIKKSAWIAGNGALDGIHAEIRDFSRRELPVFKNIRQAVTWLIKD